jgi:hypothetical protein
MPTEAMIGMMMDPRVMMDQRNSQGLTGHLWKSGWRLLRNIKQA